tara:strand:- start:582 stop:1118 length:537 start_codon:yes stop_codon:yes gene_type:complete
MRKLPIVLILMLLACSQPKSPEVQFQVFEVSEGDCRHGDSFRYPFILQPYSVYTYDSGSKGRYIRGHSLLLSYRDCTLLLDDCYGGKSLAHQILYAPPFVQNPEIAIPPDFTRAVLDPNNPQTSGPHISHFYGTPIDQWDSIAIYFGNAWSFEKENTIIYRIAAYKTVEQDTALCSQQ